MMTTRRRACFKLACMEFAGTFPSPRRTAFGCWESLGNWMILRRCEILELVLQGKARSSQPSAYTIYVLKLHSSSAFLSLRPVANANHSQNQERLS